MPWPDPGAVARGHIGKETEIGGKARAGLGLHPGYDGSGTARRPKKDDILSQYPQGKPVGQLRRTARAQHGPGRQLVIRMQVIKEAPASYKR